MLTISNITYTIGGRTILENCSVNIMDGWKVGIVGVNGAGKSTLFKIISGDLQADSGKVSISVSQKLGMVRQDIPQTQDSLLDIVLASHEEMAQLWKESETETDPQKISDIYERLSELDAYSAPAKAGALLMGLGFSEEQLSEPFASFSGGWQMRVALAAALFVEPEILLLDEPTNHLDLEAIMWLESYLVNYPHTLLIISHDREVLNKCIDHVVHVENKDLTLYTGNYDTFERERAQKRGLQQKVFEKQQAQRAHMQKFVNRFKAQASKARQAQSRVKALEKMDLVDAVIADRAIKFTFPNPEEIPSPMISINHADIGYGDDVTILRNIHENIDNDDRIALLGANGNGKSTLMKLIAGKLGVQKGNIFHAGKLRIGYFSQHQTEELDVNTTPYHAMYEIMKKSRPNVNEPTVRAKLGAFGFSHELSNNKISSLSGGEKARLLFAFMSFDAPHLLLLDEPTNHLDIDAREALVQALNNYEGAIVIVSHDPNMVERVADRLWLVKDGKCMPFEGDIEEYRKFTIASRKEERAKEKQKKEKLAKEEAKKAEATPEEPQKKKASYAEVRAKQELEEKMSKLEKKKKTLEEAMADPDFYANDNQKVVKTQNDYQKTVKELEECENKWLEMGHV